MSVHLCVILFSHVRCLPSDGLDSYSRPDCDITMAGLSYHAAPPPAFHTFRLTLTGSCVHFMSVMCHPRDKGIASPITLTEVYCWFAAMRPLWVPARTEEPFELPCALLQTNGEISEGPVYTFIVSPSFRPLIIRHPSCHFPTCPYLWLGLLCLARLLLSSLAPPPSFCSHAQHVAHLSPMLPYWGVFTYLLV